MRINRFAAWTFYIIAFGAPLLFSIPLVSLKTVIAILAAIFFALMDIGENRGDR